MECIILEDNIEYEIVEKIKYQEKEYIFLSNTEDPKDFCIRKVIVENEQKFLVGLDDDKEFDLALMLFAKNHKEEMGKFN